MRKKLYLFTLLILFAAIGIYFWLFESDLFMDATPFFPRPPFQEKVFSLSQGQKISYWEKGSGPTLIFLHGFQGEKGFWIPFINRLSSNYHVIAIDLPGHGKSSVPTHHRDDVYGFAEDILQFVESKHIERFFLFGHSMGGGVATAFTYLNPSKVQGLILLSPFGVSFSEKSDIQKGIKDGYNPLFPATLHQFDDFVTYLKGKPIRLSLLEKWLFLHRMKKNRTYHLKIYENFFSMPTLDLFLKDIHTPVFLLYGKKDRVLHQSSFQTFEENLPSVQSKVFKNGHHLFSRKQNGKSMSLIEDFLKKNSSTL